MNIGQVIVINRTHYIAIPPAYVTRLQLTRKSYVTIELTDKGLLIRPLRINTKETQSGYENKTPETS